jgi:hypothetical protein
MAAAGWSMWDTIIIWNDAPGKNVEHVQANGLTPDEVDSVILDNTIPIDFSRSSGLPCKQGWTDTGRYIFVVWRVVNNDPHMVYPVTAYEPTDE